MVFQRSTPDTMVLDGTVTGHREHIQLKRVDHIKFQFAARGFHWIQEYPFNR